MDPTVKTFFRSFIKFSLYAIVLISAALVLGVPSASFIAVLSSIGLAIGLAMQGSLSNFAGSVMLLMFHPYKVGDYVTVNGVSGKVQAINLFYTVIQTVDHKRTTIPNGGASNSVVSVADYSGLEIRRMDLNMTAADDESAEKAKDILLKLAREQEGVKKDPAPTLLEAVQGDGTVKYTLRLWCSGADYWKVYYELTQKVSLEMAKVGIVIPFPQNEAL